MTGWTVDEPAAAHPGRAGRPAGRPTDQRAAQRGRHRRPGPGRRHPDRPPAGPGRPPRRRLTRPARAPAAAGPTSCWWLGQLDPPLSRADVSIAVPGRRPGRPGPGRGLAGRLRAAPARPRVDVTAGQITLMGLRGGTSAKIISGPVEALGVGGDLTLETVSGEVTLADSAAGRVRAQHRLRGDHLRPGQPAGAARSGSSTISGQHHRPGPRGQRPRRPPAHRLRPDHQRLPAGCATVGFGR